MTVELFLKKIGRMCDQYAALFTSWDHFWQCDSRNMKTLGVALRDRKYILNWMSKYKNGMLQTFILYVAYLEELIRILCGCLPRRRRTQR
jgi:hypothetical protein